MKVKVAFLAIVLLSGFVAAADWEENEVVLDITYASKYLWRGIDRLDDVSAWQPSITMPNINGSGFTAQVWMSYAGGGGSGRGVNSRVDATEYDYILAYDFSMWKDERYVTDVHANFIYYDFTDAPNKLADAQELGADFSWPCLMKCGWTPHYYVGRIWAAKSDSLLNRGPDYNGWVHILGLAYEFTTCPMDGVGSMPIKLTADAVFNDGYAAASSDWSHITWGAQTEWMMGSAKVAPGVYYQTSMEDTVNTEDELYTMVSVSWTF
jgi:hypothetical protein